MECTSGTAETPLERNLLSTSLLLPSSTETTSLYLFFSFLLCHTRMASTAGSNKSGRASLASLVVAATKCNIFSAFAAVLCLQHKLTLHFNYAGCLFPDPPSHLYCVRVLFSAVQQNNIYHIAVRLEVERLHLQLIERPQVITFDFRCGVGRKLREYRSCGGGDLISRCQVAENKLVVDMHIVLLTRGNDLYAKLFKPGACFPEGWSRLHFFHPQTLSPATRARGRPPSSAPRMRAGGPRCCMVRNRVRVRRNTACRRGSGTG